MNKFLCILFSMNLSLFVSAYMPYIFTSEIKPDYHVAEAITFRVFYHNGQSDIDITESVSIAVSVTNPDILKIVSPGLIMPLKRGDTTLFIRYINSENRIVIDEYDYPIHVLELNDSDDDGMPDSWEIAHGLNPHDPSDALRDDDEDGLDNLTEYQLGTDPKNPDTDGDGMFDGLEVILGLDPKKADYFTSDCMAMLANRVSPIAKGSVAIENIPFDFGYYRLRVLCGNKKGITGFFKLNAAEPVTSSRVDFNSFEAVPVSIKITSPKVLLTQIGETIQLQAIATLPDGTTKDLSTAALGTYWFGTNGYYADLTPDGLLTARHGGVIFTVMGVRSHLVYSIS